MSRAPSATDARGDCVRGRKSCARAGFAAPKGHHAKQTKETPPCRASVHRSKAEAEDQTRLHVHFRGNVSELNEGRHCRPPIAVPIRNVGAAIDN